MSNPHQVRHFRPVMENFAAGTQGADFKIFHGEIWLGGVITTRAEADELIKTIDALKPVLWPDAEPSVVHVEEPENA